jgi:hypothetical protein
VKFGDGTWLWLYPTLMLGGFVLGIAAIEVGIEKYDRRRVVGRVMLAVGAAMSLGAVVITIIAASR